MLKPFVPKRCRLNIDSSMQSSNLCPPNLSQFYKRQVMRYASHLRRRLIFNNIYFTQFNKRRASPSVTWGSSSVGERRVHAKVGSSNLSFPYKFCEVLHMTRVSGCICKDCGEPFAMQSIEIEYYENKGWEQPKRCAECRKKKRENRVISPSPLSASYFYNKYLNDVLDPRD